MMTTTPGVLGSFLVFVRFTTRTPPVGALHAETRGEPNERDLTAAHEKANGFRDVQGPLTWGRAHFGAWCIVSAPLGNVQLSHARSCAGARFLVVLAALKLF